MVIRTCFRRPEDRFETAEEFGDAFEDVADKLTLLPFRIPSPVSSTAANAAVVEGLTEDFRRPGSDHFDDRHDTTGTAPERLGHGGYSFLTDTPGSPVSSQPPGPPNIFDDFDDPKALKYPLSPDTQGP